MRFEPMKAVEAAAVIARAEGKRLSRLRMLKLLYISERRLAKISSRRLLNDKLVAMDHGPLHSEVYNMIKGTSIASNVWSEHFKKTGRDVILEKEPELQLLSKLEVETMVEVVREFENLNDWRISKETHLFEEWKNNYIESTSSRIEFSELLKAVGRSPEYLEESKASDQFDRLLEKYSH